MLRWLFLDMDNYFASVEQQARPELRGKPVGIIPVVSRGTCCIAASKEAKARGVKTGTNVLEARQRCPDIRFVVARPAYYVEVHHQILKAIDTVAPVERVESVDEMAVRLLGPEREPRVALQMAETLKHHMRQAIGEHLTCSIGVAPTRLLAKVACELNKPDGLMRLDDDNLPEALLHLKLTDLPGINTGRLRRLLKQRVETVEQLWALSAHEMRDAWGSVDGERYWCDLHGQDVPPIRTHRSTFGHANVLAPELRTDAGAHAVMTRLLHKAAARLRAHGYAARSLSASVRLGMGDRSTRWADAIDLPTCQDTLTIAEHFARLWQSYPTGQGQPTKVGVTLAGLLPIEVTTGHLFDEPTHRETLGHVMDTINTKFGGHTLYLGGMHHVASHDMTDKIAFGRVPDEAVNV